MKSLVRKIEEIGRTASLKQHSSVKQMLESGQLDVDLIEEIFKNSKEMICAVEGRNDK